MSSKLRLPNAASCECPPDPKVLFGPEDADVISHSFDVAPGEPVFIDAFGLEPGASVSFQRVYSTCGQSFTKDATDICGDLLRITEEKTSVILSIPGRYQARIEGMEPDDALVTQCPLGATLNYTAICGSAEASAAPESLTAQEIVDMIQADQAACRDLASGLISAEPANNIRTGTDGKLFENDAVPGVQP